MPHLKLSKICFWDKFFEKETKIATHMGKNIVKKTTATKVGVLTMDCILHVSYMYCSIKYRNYILNVISRTRY